MAFKSVEAIDQEAYRKLIEARCRLLIRAPFYGHIAMTMEWRPSDMSWIEQESRKRVSVRIVDTGRVEVLYYPPYIKSKNLKQLFGIIQHVIEHLMRLHPVRRDGRNKKIWDECTDMAVNGRRSNPRIGYDDSYRGLVLPGDQMIWCPPEYNVSDNAESHYSRRIKEDDHGDMSEFMIDDHEAWGQTTVGEDEVRQLVKTMVSEAASSSPGNVPGHVSELLRELAKPVIKWREILRKYLGRHVGNRRKTHSRRNRRNDSFGSPGWSHHAAAKLSVIIDTSASVDSKMLEQFFAEIEAIAYKSRINILQWDYEFQGYGKYRRGDWRNIEIRGRGGTNMCAPLEWLEENGLVGDACVMLTDGYCYWPNRKQYPVIFVISREYGSHNDSDYPDWGDIVKVNS